MPVELFKYPGWAFHFPLSSTCFATSRKQLTPYSNVGNKIEPYFLHGGCGQIFKVTSVTTPRVPSEPKITWCKSGPLEIRGPWQLFCRTPFGVTKVTWTIYANWKFEWNLKLNMKSDNFIMFHILLFINRLITRCF